MQQTPKGRSSLSSNGSVGVWGGQKEIKWTKFIGEAESNTTLLCFLWVVILRFASCCGCTASARKQGSHFHSLRFQSFDIHTMWRTYTQARVYKCNSNFSNFHKIINKCLIFCILFFLLLTQVSNSLYNFFITEFES